MVFVATVRRLNLSIVASQWKILSTTSKNFSSSTGYSSEEIEKFRKVFRTMPSYEESISSKEITAYLQLMNYIKPAETYRHYEKYIDNILGGRLELTQLVKYVKTQHDPSLSMTEYLKDFDRNNDGYVSKEEFEYGMETVRAQFPGIKHTSYADFLKEADANKDGKISVTECVDWLKKNVVV
ncbi:hypothetical protein HA402_008406 [Bradysia odoriphaga]|nr:hypothetical protein HA402_008406 [Bradysia odoriphaga]